MVSIMMDWGETWARSTRLYKKWVSGDFVVNYSDKVSI
jgi:hypothetical protein